MSLISFSRRYSVAYYPGEAILSTERGRAICSKCFGVARVYLSERGVTVSWSLKAILAAQLSLGWIVHRARSRADFLLSHACLVELLALAKLQRHFPQALIASRSVHLHLDLRHILTTIATTVLVLPPGFEHNYCSPCSHSAWAKRPTTDMRRSNSGEHSPASQATLISC